MESFSAQYRFSSTQGANQGAHAENVHHHKLLYSEVAWHICNRTNFHAFHFSFATK